MVAQSFPVVPVTTVISVPAWVGCFLILFATFGVMGLATHLHLALVSFKEAMVARRDYYRQQMSSPAGPVPKPAAVGSPEGADLLRAAMADHDADTHKEN